MKKQLTFTKTTQKELKKWLNLNGFYCGVRRNGTSLCYNPYGNFIHLKNAYDDEIDWYFSRYLRANGLQVKTSMVIMSVLHELGHFMTINLFTDDEWQIDSIRKQYGTYVDENAPLKEKAFKYWDCVTELYANKWAINFANNFPKKVKELERIIKKTADFSEKVED